MPLYLAHFITLDREDGGSRAGAEISHVFRGASTNLRYEGHASYYDDDLGAGFYVSLPGLLGTKAQQGRDLIGNAAAGAMFAASDEDGQTIAFHIGAMLPTSYTFRTNNGATIIPFESRVTDASQTGYDTAYGAQAGISAMRRIGRTFSQFDLGGEWLHPHSSFHINGALGIDFGNIALLFESTNGNATSHWTDEGAIGLRATLGPAQPYAALIGGVVENGPENGPAKTYLGFTLGVDMPLY
ncbi:MAG: hypothetical protein JO257_17660 [Deltaproteobacteria bacterium]|nr:hypothetical protein [Deltaproteobacteria bacterium]